MTEVGKKSLEIDTGSGRSRSLSVDAAIKISSTSIQHRIFSPLKYQSESLKPRSACKPLTGDTSPEGDPRGDWLGDLTRVPLSRIRSKYSTLCAITLMSYLRPASLVEDCSSTSFASTRNKTDACATSCEGSPSPFLHQLIGNDVGFHTALTQLEVRQDPSHSSDACRSTNDAVKSKLPDLNELHAQVGCIDDVVMEDVLRCVDKQ